MSKILPFARPAVKPARKRPVRIPADVTFPGETITGKPLPVRKPRKSA